VDLTLLESTLDALGEPPYRARQVWEWTAHGAAGYEAMTNLPRALRDELEANVPFSTLTVETQRESRDGTVKTLFRTADGHPVEAVLMRYSDRRRSLCVSSQSGCPLTCTFCATTRSSWGWASRSSTSTRCSRRRGGFPTSASRIAARRSRRSGGCPG
jgi:23S rRNA (adenine2503-C2)-methyltransferase